MKQYDPKDNLIVALDGSTQDLLWWARELKGTVSWVKIGMTNFYAEGPQLVRQVQEYGYKIFLDLKLHDIPHQVRGAAFQLAQLGVDMVTIHASGGSDMIAAAREGLDEGAKLAHKSAPKLLAVTVLTSLDDNALHALGVESSSGEHVKRLAQLAYAAGADGVVCSPLESALVRETLGDDALIVTPGVRPQWAAANDQMRITTPSQALKNGSTHLVIGRPITAANDKAQAILDILEEMKEACNE